MKQRKTLSNWLTSRFLVIIRNEETFEEKRTIKFNYVKILLIIGLGFIVFSGVSFALVTTVLSRWFDPRVQSMEANRVLIELEEKVDSLAIEVDKKDQYIYNIKNILEGNVDADVNEIDQKNKEEASVMNLNEINPIDSEFRKEFEDIDYEQLNRRSTTKDALMEIFFFPPITGIVSRAYDIKGRHYGTDIVAKSNEPIKAIADGSVILSSWTQDSGYVIGIQHKSQLISFYKHNSVLLKKVGETVKAGDIVAIIGNSGEYSDGTHLHFELWYNGNPVNPEDFISF